MVAHLSALLRNNQMNEVYIHQHLGLGDHIICNGLIRNLYKIHDKINLFACQQHFESISFMFRDLPNLNVISIPGVYNDNYVADNYNNQQIIKIGFDNVQRLITQHNCSWDESFYIQFNIPFNLRWDDFFIKRDINSEKLLYKKLNPKNEKFILIHSTGSDNIDRIDYSKINSNLLKIEVKKGITNNVFDYLKLIEYADEIHCISSFFNVLCDSVETSGKIYFHDTIKKRNIGVPHKLKKTWELV